MNKKNSLFIPIQWYHPGFRAGGIIQAIKRLAGALARDYHVFILTTNYDLYNTTSYPNIQTDIWHQTKEGFHVKYLSADSANCQQIAKEIRDLQPDFIYLKSMFNPRFALFPLWLKYQSKTDATLILAPSGMLKESALSIKKWKKKPLLLFIRYSSFYKKIRWQATDIQEQKDIKLQMGNDATIFLLPEFPPKIESNIKILEKKESLKILYLSRIHPIKNLSFLLNILKQVKTRVTLTIGGPVEDVDYMLDCEKLIKLLPDHITILQIGEVPHEKVKKQFDHHHVFILPSKGEGFGNVILEALSNACPVIISDQTPWKNLSQYNAGWDLSLNHPEAFIAAIEKVAAMDQSEFDRLCESALNYAKQSIDREELVSVYCKMLELE
jgi:glycosyltransferase involved in cell wall biosynthesis